MLRPDRQFLQSAQVCMIAEFDSSSFQGHPPKPHREMIGTVRRPIGQLQELTARPAMSQWTLRCRRSHVENVVPAGRGSPASRSRRSSNRTVCRIRPRAPRCRNNCHTERMCLIQQVQRRFRKAGTATLMSSVREANVATSSGHSAKPAALPASTCLAEDSELRIPASDPE